MLIQMDLTAAEQILDVDVLHGITPFGICAFQHGVAFLHDLDFQVQTAAQFIDAPDILGACAGDRDQRHLHFVFFYDLSHVQRIAEHLLAIDDLADPGIVHETDDVRVDAAVLHDLAAQDISAVSRADDQRILRAVDFCFTPSEQPVGQAHAAHEQDDEHAGDHDGAHFLRTDRHQRPQQQREDHRHDHRGE